MGKHVLLSIFINVVALILFSLSHGLPDLEKIEMNPEPLQLTRVEVEITEVEEESATEPSAFPAPGIQSQTAQSQPEQKQQPVVPKPSPAGNETPQSVTQQEQQPGPIEEEQAKTPDPTADEQAEPTESQGGTEPTSTGNESQEVDDLVDQILASQTDMSTLDAKIKEDVVWSGNVKRWTVKKTMPQLLEKYASVGHNITVRIYIEINKYGYVVSAAIALSTGFLDFDQYILKIVKQWQFNQVSYDRIDSGYINITFVLK